MIVDSLAHPASPIPLALEILGLMLFCSLGPGLLIVRKFRFSPLEKLCAATAGSMLVVYLASFALFCTGAPRVAYLAVSGVFALMTVVAWPQLLVIWRNRSSRSVILAFVLLLGWEFLHLCLVTNFGGGTWAGDWYEHFDRTRYFLHERGNNYLYVDLYLLPARPPMMNLIAAFFCQQVGRTFTVFSLVFLLLNAWAFVPCCLFLQRLAPRLRRRVMVLAILFMLNPSIVQNATYSWTKAMTAGLVVGGICFYLRAMRGDGRIDAVRLAASGVFFAAGILCHYSAAPLVLAVAAHFLIQVYRRPRTIVAALPGLAISAGILATWFVWSVAVFGLHKTTTSNTTFGWMHDESILSVAGIFCYNCFTVLVPHPLHGVPEGWFHSFHLNNLGEIRDYFFLMMQYNLTMMIGSTGGVIAAILTYWYFREDDPRGKTRRQFWMLFLPAGYLLGIAALPGKGPYGGAHLTLQPMVMLALCLLAAKVPAMPKAMIIALLIGLMFDYSLGVLLNFDRHSYGYETIGTRETRISMVPDEKLGFKQAMMEYGIKEAEGYVFWADYFAGDAVLLEILSGCGAVAAMLLLMRLWIRSQWERGRSAKPPAVLSTQGSL